MNFAATKLMENIFHKVCDEKFLIFNFYNFYFLGIILIKIFALQCQTYGALI